MVDVGDGGGKLTLADLVLPLTPGLMDSWTCLLDLISSLIHSSKCLLPWVTFANAFLEWLTLKWIEPLANRFVEVFTSAGHDR